MSFFVQSSDSSTDNSVSPESPFSSGARQRHSHRRQRHTPHTKHAGRSLISCVPPYRLRKRITRGKYVDFDRLLLPLNAPPLAGVTPPKRRATTHRKVHDGTTWLEAWNQYIGTRVDHDPASALQLIKYQTLMAMLFVHHPAAACIEYDRLFRQTAATISSTRWDRLKDDIFVWALTLPTHIQPSHSSSPGTPQRSLATHLFIACPNQHASSPNSSQTGHQSLPAWGHPQGHPVATTGLPTLGCLPSPTTLPAKRVQLGTL